MFNNRRVPVVASSSAAPCSGSPWRPTISRRARTSAASDNRATCRQPIPTRTCKWLKRMEARRKSRGKPDIAGTRRSREAPPGARNNRVGIGSPQPITRSNHESSRIDQSSLPPRVE